MAQHETSELPREIPNLGAVYAGTSSIPLQSSPGSDTWDLRFLKACLASSVAALVHIPFYIAAAPCRPFHHRELHEALSCRFMYWPMEDRQKGELCKSTSGTVRPSSSPAIRSHYCSSPLCYPLDSVAPSSSGGGESSTLPTMLCMPQTNSQHQQGLRLDLLPDLWVPLLAVDRGVESTWAENILTVISSC